MKWLIIIPVILIGLIVGTSFYLQPNDFYGCSDAPLAGSDGCEKADAIVVVSGGDTGARTAEGIRLFENGWADRLVLSGAAQDKSGPSNAAVMKLQAIEAGVPSSAIYIDEDAETTEENAANSQSIFADHDFKTVILVTSGYHQRRANLEFEKRAGSIEILNHPLTSDQDWSFWWWATPRGWWLAGSEVIKVIAFYAQGSGS